MLAHAPKLYSEADYLALDVASEARHEFLDGRVFAMAGAEPEHNQVVSNLSFALNQRLRDRGCRVLFTDQRVLTTDNAYFYPDLVVACEPPIYAPTRPKSLKNPNLLIEVLSRSTSTKDRREKLLAYQQIDTVLEYWLIETGQPLAIRYYRTEEGWGMQGVLGLEATLRSNHLAISIPMREVYTFVDVPEHVDWKAESPSDAASEEDG